MMIDVAMLMRIAGPAAIASNVNSVIVALSSYAALGQLEPPHRLAQYLAQLDEESGGFHYDKELWGPTAAQSGYEGRRDLGNTHPGDGKKYMGRTGIQLTGAHNYRLFRDWCALQHLTPPDFVAHPEEINTDPWEGLAPIWYWAAGNQTGRSLNAYADAGNIEMITRMINGGMNGFGQRLADYTRIGLALAGFDPDQHGAVLRFQQAAQKAGLLPADTTNSAGRRVTPCDGIPGPQTRAALHATLKAMGPATP